MKNIYDVMRQKEAEIQQLQRDIEALRVAARLLAEDSEANDFARGNGASTGASGGGAPALRPAVGAPAPKAAEVTYSSVRENSLRQFP